MAPEDAFSLRLFGATVDVSEAIKTQFTGCTVFVFGQMFSLEDAVEFHVCLKPVTECTCDRTACLSSVCTRTGCHHNSMPNTEGNHHGSLHWILTMKSVTALTTSHNTEGNHKSIGFRIDGAGPEDKICTWLVRSLINGMRWVACDQRWWIPGA